MMLGLCLVLIPNPPASAWLSYSIHFLVPTFRARTGIGDPTNPFKFGGCGGGGGEEEKEQEEDN